MRASGLASEYWLVSMAFRSKACLFWVGGAKWALGRSQIESNTEPTLIHMNNSLWNRWGRARKRSYYTEPTAGQNSLQSDQQDIVLLASQHLEWLLFNRTSLCSRILPGCTFKTITLGEGWKWLLQFKHKHPKTKSWGKRRNYWKRWLHLNETTVILFEEHIAEVLLPRQGWSGLVGFGTSILFTKQDIVLRTQAK